MIENDERYENEITCLELHSTYTHRHTCTHCVTTTVGQKYNHEIHKKNKTKKEITLLPYAKSFALHFIHQYTTYK